MFHSARPNTLTNWVFVCFQFVCGECDQKLTTLQGYKRHMNRHEGIYPYSCPYCKKGMSCTKDIKKHLKSKHTGVTGFHCIKCYEDFKTVHLLKTHLKANTCSRDVDQEDVEKAENQNIDLDTTDENIESNNDENSPPKNTDLDETL